MNNNSRADLAAFLGLNEFLYKDNLDKMLETLPSDELWDESDDYERLMKAGQLKRYVFGHLKSTAVATAESSTVTEKASTSSSSVQVKAPLCLGDAEVPLTMVKHEFPEKKQLLELLPVLAAGRSKLGKQIEAIKGVHAKLKICKRPEAVFKADESRLMLGSMNNLDDTLINLQTTGELIDDAAEAKSWIVAADAAKDLATNTIDSAKLAVKRFQGYLDN